MFLSSLFSILCLFALLPERVPQLYSSSLPSSCYKFPRAHFFGNVLFFVVACVCLVITYLISLRILNLFLIFSLYVLFPSTVVFSVRFGLFLRCPATPG